MLRDVKDITTENPDREVWKFLRFFLDVPSTVEKIRKLHGLATGRHRDNVTKQATQIGYCIRQAEEYFHASAEVGIATRPTLLYYGVVSLARALSLLKKDGTHSFDALRKADKHNHHGLDLDKGALNIVSPNDKPEVFLSRLRATWHTNYDQPWGTFALFYLSLVPCAWKVRTTIYTDQSLTLATDVALPCADILPYESLIKHEPNALDILKTLPDMYFPLLETEIEPTLCRGSVEANSFRTLSKDSKQVSQIRLDFNFNLDGISQEIRPRLIEHYRTRNPKIRLQAELESNIVLNLTTYQEPPESAPNVPLPEMVDDLTGRVFYLLRPEAYLPEPASHFVLLFCLGMLSRYYPDIWMGAIEKNVQLSELVDSLLSVTSRKFPCLVLDQMTGVKHHFHTA